MKLLMLLFACFCLFLQQQEDDLIVEETDKEVYSQKKQTKHKLIEEQDKESEKKTKDDISDYIIQILEKYDPQKSGKILLDDYQLFLEDLYINSFDQASEEENQMMHQLIAEFIKEKQTDYISYDEAREDVNGPGFTNFFDKKMKENQKKQDDYLQQLIEDGDSELVDEKMVNEQELEQIMKPDL